MLPLHRPWAGFGGRPNSLIYFPLTIIPNNDTYSQKLDNRNKSYSEWYITNIWLLGEYRPFGRAPRRLSPLAGTELVLVWNMYILNEYIIFPDHRTNSAS